MRELNKLIFEEDEYLTKGLYHRSGSRISSSDFQFICMSYWDGVNQDRVIPVHLYRIKSTGEVGYVMTNDDSSFRPSPPSKGRYIELRDWFEMVFGDIIKGDIYTRNMLLNVD